MNVEGWATTHLVFVGRDKIEGLIWIVEYGEGQLQHLLKAAERTEDLISPTGLKHSNTNTQEGDAELGPSPCFA